MSRTAPPKHPLRHRSRVLACLLAEMVLCTASGEAGAQSADSTLRATLGGSPSTSLATSSDFGGTAGATTATSPAIGAIGIQNATGSASTLPPGTATPTSQAQDRRFLRPPRRRTGKPTAYQIRAQLRPAVAPTLAPDVQPIMTGVPDPVAPAIVARRRPIAPDDPYAQLGLRSGGLTFYPSVGESIGYDSNPNRTGGRSKGSFVAQTEGELRLQSDWSTHELTGYLRGAYDEYPSLPAANRPEGAGRLGLRLDVTRDTQIDIGGRYSIDTQRPDSPDLNARVQTRPIIFTEGATLGVTQRFNRLVATLQGTIDRSDFADAKLSNGTTLDQSDRNLNQFGVRGRLGYEITPGLIPFVEGVADKRDYDRKVDSTGFERSSNSVGGRAGASFEITRLLTGEIAVGAADRRYDDPRLRDLVAPLIDASLRYALTPLTTIRLTGQVTTDETTVVNANGVIVSRATLEVSHDLRRNLNVTAALTGTDYDYKGSFISEQSFGATLKAEYKFTRSIALRASYGFEHLWSNIAGSAYSANTFLVGMRYQP